MSLRLNGSTSGYVELDAPATAGSNTLVLPDGNGSSGQYLQTDGLGALSWQTVTDEIGAEWVDGTEQATNGAHEYVFTGLPTNVKEVTVTLNGVSWVTGSNIQFQLGTSSGLVGGSGYLHGYAYLTGGSTVTGGRVSSDAFGVGVWTSPSHSVAGSIRFTNISNNTWIAIGQFSSSFDNTVIQLAGRLDLGGTLERVAMSNRGSNNFDAGTFNIHYITTQP